MVESSQPKRICQGKLKRKNGDQSTKLLSSLHVLTITVLDRDTVILCTCVTLVESREPLSHPVYHGSGGKWWPS